MKYPVFTSKHESLMAKYLTPELFKKLEHVESKEGFTLHDVVNSGLINPDSGIGVYAGDTESYQCFAPLFNPIIRQYHGFDENALHISNLSPHDINAHDPDPANKYIVSTRIRVGRNLADMPLGPAITKAQRNEVETRAMTALTNWPAGRGIYHNTDKTFLVWVNEEDQLRIISMQAGGNIQQVFVRLTTALAELEKHLTFAFTDHLGYISSCPTNLGTAMRASVHIKLPYLGEDMTKFKAITEAHHLQIRGIHGEHSESEGHVYDISNRRRLGVTEVECVQDLYQGVVALIAQEQRLEKA